MTAQQPSQTQSHQPGRETVMRPRPDYEPFFPGVGKLADQVALNSGGDSSIVCLGSPAEPDAIAIRRGFITSGISRTSSIVSSPFVKDAPLTST